MPPSSEQLLAVARRYQIAHLALIASTVAAARALWTRHRPVSAAALDRWLTDAVPTITAAQTSAASLAVSYIGGYATLAATSPTPAPAPVDIAALVTNLRGRTTPAAVYTRPVVTVRAALAAGTPIDDALRLGADRLERTAALDTQLAGRAGWSAAMTGDQRIVGYRRVTDGNACRLCMLASTQRYHVGDLLPIHGRCGCTVVPIVGTKDPGHVLDKELLAAVNTNPAAGRRIRDVEQVRADYLASVAVHEHGELGPVLGRAGDAFTGPDDLAV